MRTFAEHQHAVRELLVPLRTRLVDPAGFETISLADAGAGALGRVLAVDVLSPVDLPAFANSQMDGYAVRASDLSGARPDSPVSLPVGVTTAAGDAVRAHTPGTASPIMTGAPIPSGADAVVPIEAADPPRFVDIGSAHRDAPAGTTVSFGRPVDPGAFVRPAGSDVASGAPLLPAGIRLRPAQLGALAAAGVTSVAVRRPVSVILVSTGHELRPPGEALDSGQIHDANTSMIAAALRESGATVHASLVPDEAAAVLAAVAASAEVVDLIVTTGGVSAGAFEVVRDAFEPLGVEFTKVAMQPGGPQGLGTARVPDRSGDGAATVPVVSFPGNPVSALVSFELFLRPVLRALAGLAPDRSRATLRLAHSISSPIDRHQVRRGVLDGNGDVEVGAPSSHLLHDYANATVLVHLPMGVGDLPAGANVDVWRIDD